MYRQSVLLLPRIGCSRDENAISKSRVMDGIFPFSTNAKRDASAVLRAYKYQPALEIASCAFESGPTGRTGVRRISLVEIAPGKKRSSHGPEVIGAAAKRRDRCIPLRLPGISHQDVMGHLVATPRHDFRNGRRFEARDVSHSVQEFIGKVQAPLMGKIQGGEVVALGASLLPAFRAASIHPMAFRISRGCEKTGRRCSSGTRSN